MADSSTPSPSKPKPGSLRDRIAAFEKSSAAATATPERAPVRPKGSNISWKPSVSSPDNASGDGEKKPAFGANDAKESIKSGGSLKERMAALQGKGGMGGASPLTPPTPQSVKPVRAPPPGLSPSSKEELESPKETGTEESEKDRTASEGRETTATEGAEEKEKPEATAEVEEDEEANERERRAAIAARMARLGGTKIGFAAPPVFGRKPNRSKSTEEVSAESRGTSVDDTGVIPSESKELDTTVSKDITGDVTKSEEITRSSLVKSPSSEPAEQSISPEPSLSSSRSQPSSMPVPALPRRAAPPRSRSSKSQKSDAENREKSEATPDIPSIPVEDQQPTEGEKGEVSLQKSEELLSTPEATVSPEATVTLDATVADIPVTADVTTTQSPSPTADNDSSPSLQTSSQVPELPEESSKAISDSISMASEDASSGPPEPGTVTETSTETNLSAQEGDVGPKQPSNELSNDVTELPQNNLPDESRESIPGVDERKIEEEPHSLLKSSEALDN